MPDIAIKFENLSKRYRLGVKEKRHDTLIGATASWITSPLANFRRLRKLTRFDDTPPFSGKSTVSKTDNLPHEIHDSDSAAHFTGAHQESRIAHSSSDQVLGIIGRNRSDSRKTFVHI